MSLSYPENSDWNVSSAEERERPEKNRLKAYGELSIDAAAFIDILIKLKHQNIDQIDYTFKFSVESLETQPILPAILKGQTLRDIAITTGETNGTNEDGTTSRLAYLSATVMTEAGDLAISRSSESFPEDEDEPDMFIDLEGLTGDETSSKRDAFRGLSDDEQNARMRPIPKISQAELNTLLMSIVLPHNTEFSHFTDKDLLAPDTFPFLAESLRNHAYSYDINGHYLFADETTDLQFNNIDNDERFTIAYDDPAEFMNRRLAARASTAQGFDLEFSAYPSESGTKESFHPLIEDVEYIRALIAHEVRQLHGEATTQPIPVIRDQTVDTETIAIAHLGEDFTTPERKAYDDIAGDVEAFLAAQDTNPDTNDED